MRGVRGRLLVTIVGLVALTSVVLGAGAYLYVATSLRGQQQEQAVAQTDFNVGVLADQVLPADATKQDVVDTGLIEAFELRGGAGTIVDFGDGDPLTSGFVAANALAQLSPELRSLVERGEIGFERLVLDGTPYLVTGARRPDGGPAFYFLFDAAATEAAIAQLGQALLVGGLVLTGLAALAAGFLARGILRPVRDASDGRRAHRGGRPVRAPAGRFARRVRGVGGDVQPDGCVAGADRGRAAACPGPAARVRRRRVARAAHADDRARPGGGAPARPPRRAAVRTVVAAASCSFATWRGSARWSTT